MAGAVVAAVIAAAVVTSLLPPAARDIVLHTPVAIVVLIVGTGWLLWRISRPERGAPGR